jgi:segregation and condensation protein B
VIRKAGKKRGAAGGGSETPDPTQGELNLPHIPPERATDPAGQALLDPDGDDGLEAAVDAAGQGQGEGPTDAEGGAAGEADEDAAVEEAQALTRDHLRGLLEALVFASDKPITAKELARLASAPVKEVKELLGELHEAYAKKGITLDEVAGGWLFRTAAVYAPFVRELAGGRPVRLSRAQIETLAIAAYRQPITRPEIDEIRGVDSGATLKLLLERDLVRIIGKKDEPGRPILYGTTTQFLEFFGLKSLKDLPSLREFTELSDESRRAAEAELGEALPAAPRPPADEASAGDEAPAEPPQPGFDIDVHDTLPPPPAEDSVSDLDAIPNGIERRERPDDDDEEDTNDA